MHVPSFKIQKYSTIYQSVDTSYSDELYILHSNHQLEHGLGDLPRRRAGLAILDTESGVAL
jgi:hypothetical protein